MRSFDCNMYRLLSNQYSETFGIGQIVFHIRGAFVLGGILNLVYLVCLFYLTYLTCPI